MTIIKMGKRKLQEFLFICEECACEFRCKKDETQIRLGENASHLYYYRCPVCNRDTRGKEIRSESLFARLWG